MRHSIRGFVLAVCIIIGALPQATRASEIGRGLFFGTEDRGVSVSLGGSAAQLSAKVFPCANCHGRDGLGGEEGALSVPAIAGMDLNANEISLALKDGIGRDGRRLDRAMPRYDLARDQAASLAEFLSTLARYETEGVSASDLKVVVLHDGATQQLANAFLEGFAAEATHYRIWGRSISARLDTIDGLSLLPPFLILGAALSDPRARAHLNEMSIPQIAPLHPVDAGTYDLLPLCATREDQILSLLETVDDGAVLAVHPMDPVIRQELEKRGLEVQDRPSLGGTTLLLSARPDMVALAARSAVVLGLAEQLSPDAAPYLVSQGVRLHLADACGRLVTTADRAAELGRIAGRNIVAALQQIGRQVTRARLLQALARQPDFVDPKPQILRFSAKGG